MLDVRFRPKADIEYLKFAGPFNRTTLMLWLYQDHALKAFWASVGNVEGHCYDLLEVVIDLPHPRNAG